MPVNFVELHEAAIGESGLSDFGGSEYIDPLMLLIGEVNESPRNKQIEPRFRSIAINALKSRLASEAGWKKYPQALAQPIERPVVITGLPRSGTTILHFLMSVDPQFQWTPRWIGEAPLPRPSRDAWEDHPQFQAVHQRLEAQFAANPGLRAAHDMGAALADECITLMIQSFMSNTFNSTLPLPGYRAWWYSAGEEPSYRRYKDNLRLIGLNDPDKTWLLKNPSHSYGLDPLLKVFPDARVIILHRNPVETIASGASLTWRNAAFWDKEEVGPIRLDIYARATERMAQARAEHPHANIFDLHYRDLVGDKMGAIQRIYDHYGLTLSEATAEAMQAFIMDNPQGKHGAHKYSSDEFGITDDNVRDRFQNYISTFGL